MEDSAFHHPVPSHFSFPLFSFLFTLLPLGALPQTSYDVVVHMRDAKEKCLKIKKCLKISILEP